jgi:DNA polymerase-3 subunit gamma/tau
MRDAYTIFDQVVSFSGGNIRAALIKETLGLVGLEELNALADACADNNTAGAFEVVDRLLDAGIAIEQFVIDLAGYYRSLMLLKAGILRESLLGYGPDRFSAKVRDKLSLPQLEEGLSLLLGVYRNIRYSLSPRFELETAVSKLCWLDAWISPPELRSAIEAARSALGPGSAASPSAVPPLSAGSGSPGPAAGSGPALPAESFMDKPGAFTEGFKQVLAQRSLAGRAGEQKQNISDDAELVRQVFRGTVVNQDGER